MFHLFGKALSTGLSKLQFTCPEDHFENFCWKVVCSIFFGHWVKKFWPFTEKVSAGRSKLQSECPEKYFMEKNFFEKRVFFTSSDTDRKNFGFLAKCLQQGCKNCIPVQKILLGKIFSTEIFYFWYFTGHLAENFQFHGEYFAARLSKLASTYPEDWSGNYFGGKNPTFWEIVWKTLDVCETISGGFCRNYTLRVRSNISRKTVFFWEKTSSSKFWQWAKTKWFLCRTFFSGISKTVCPISRGTIWVNVFPEFV